MKTLGKDDIVAMFERNQPRRPVKEVLLSKDRRVFIRKLTVGDQNTKLEIAKQGLTRFNHTGYWIAISLCDENGNPFFTANQADEMDELFSDVGTLLFREIAKFNGFGKEEHDFFEQDSSRMRSSPSNSTSANGSAALTQS